MHELPLLTAKILPGITRKHGLINLQSHSYEFRTLNISFWRRLYVLIRWALRGVTSDLFHGFLGPMKWTIRILDLVFFLNIKNVLE